MEAKNICPWLRIGTNQRCGRKCEAEYCYYHAYAIRQGRKIPTECKICGRGNQCIVNVCKFCNQSNELNKFYYSQKNLFNKTLSAIQVN
jgi:hypothetical protein